jgi:hypothetical protein
MMTVNPTPKVAQELLLLSWLHPGEEGGQQHQDDGEAQQPDHPLARIASCQVVVASVAAVGVQSPDQGAQDDEAQVLGEAARIG